MRNTPERWESGVDGAGTYEWYGTVAPIGASGFWAAAPINSVYVQKTATVNRRWTKVKNNQADNDWVQGLRCLAVTVPYSAFTPSSTIGTYDLTEQIPARAWVQQAILVDVTGFTGGANASATIQIGDGTTVARYSTGTPSVFTTAVAIDLGVPSGTKIHTTAATVRITITVSSAFNTITAGSLTLLLYYLG